jgi:cytochrome c553
MTTRLLPPPAGAAGRAPPGSPRRAPSHTGCDARCAARCLARGRHPCRVRARSWAAAAALLACSLAAPAAQAQPGAAAVPAAAPVAATAASTARRPVTDTIAQRVLACTGCHGAEGRASNEGYFPRIAGKPAGYLYNQLLHFREGRRRNARMTYLVDPLSDAYLHEMAAHFASLDLPYPPPAKTDPDPAQRARGEALVRQGDRARGVPACAGCHGTALMGREPATPGLLALPRDYLIAQLGRWQIGLRRTAEPDCMAQIAKKLTPQDINALANWLPAQPVPAGAKPEPAPSPSEPAPALRCAGVSEVRP